MPPRGDGEDATTTYHERNEISTKSQEKHNGPWWSDEYQGINKASQIGRRLGIETDAKTKCTFEVMQNTHGGLERLLEEDKLVLDRFTTDCFAGTPLHISAMLGHLEFERNISSQIPVFAKELDFRRSSPLHWATANGHLEVVKALLLVNPSCISVLNTTR
ncbi:hypothetical protein NC652_039434 [Populus alba x Populus x berolinensis]|nr:hypothetical protein NC652_039434 [Populus alba x Populus x berolinensis]